LLFYTVEQLFLIKIITMIFKKSFDYVIFFKEEPMRIKYLFFCFLQ